MGGRRIVYQLIKPRARLSDGNRSHMSNVRYYVRLSTRFLHNVEVNRSKKGAAPAPQETCLTRKSVPTIGSTQTKTGVDRRNLMADGRNCNDSPSPVDLMAREFIRRPDNMNFIPRYPYIPEGS